MVYALMSTQVIRSHGPVSRECEDPEIDKIRVCSIAY